MEGNQDDCDEVDDIAEHPPENRTAHPSVRDVITMAAIHNRTAALPGLSRRAFGRSAVGLLAVAAAGSAVTGTAHADLPVVSMKSLLIAAQVDPVRGDGETTPGAEAGVRTVEDALVAAGHLEARLADGSFGSSTIAAYAAFQESLGYSGLGANGLPGPASLAKLGENRFQVVDEITIGEHVELGGVTVNARTRDMLAAAQKRCGLSFDYPQGSYNVGVPASAGTHDGGGAIDISVSEFSAEQCTAAVTALREVGFAAWLRTTDQGFSGDHIHGIAIGDTDAADVAQSQVGDYFLGRNGLKGHGEDDGPKVDKVIWEDVR